MHLLTLILALALSQDATPEEETAARGCVTSLLKALDDGKGKEFADLFHNRRLLLEVYAQTGFGKAADAQMERLEKMVRLTLVQMAAAQKESGGWGALHRSRVQRVGAKTEFELSCVLKDEFGVKDRYRFWLIKDAGAWKVYDFESLNDGLRLSNLLTGLLASVGEDPEKGKALLAAGLLLQKALHHLNEGELEEGLAALRKADFKVMPESVVPLLETMEGAFLSGLGKEEEALAVYDGALRRRSDLPRAHQLRWETCLALERYADAIESGRDFIRILGDDAEAYHMIGVASRHLGKIDDALEAHRKGAACDDEDTQNRLRLGILLAQRKQPDEAAQALREAFAKSEDAASLYEETAGELIDADASDVLLTLALERKEPDSSILLYHQGHALRRLGRHAEAEALLRKGVEKDDDWMTELREELACTLGHLKREEEALKVADELEEEDAVAALYVRAYLDALRGKDDDTIRVLRSAFKEDAGLHRKVAREPVFERARSGEEGKALVARARAKYEFDDKSSTLWASDRHEALQKLSAARTQADPEDADGWYYLGFALRRLARYDKAEEALKAGLEKEECESLRPRFWDEMGHAVARSGRPQEALEWAKRLLGEENWINEGYLLQALAQVMSKDHAAALKSLARLFDRDLDDLKAIEADPAFEPLRRDPGYAALVKRVRGKSGKDDEK